MLLYSKMYLQIHHRACRTAEREYMQILSFKIDKPENNWHSFAFLRSENTNIQLYFVKDVCLSASEEQDATQRFHL